MEKTLKRFKTCRLAKNSTESETIVRETKCEKERERETAVVEKD